jgi:hypothetical protein
MKRLFGLLLALGLGAATMMAQPYFGTAWVSSQGSDYAGCGLLEPGCATLGMALVDVLTGGLVKAVDGSSYSAAGLAITRPVTIDGSGVGVLENINNINVPVITITADCTLRNLIIQVTIGDAIQIAASGVHVHLENVTIQGVPGAFDNGVLVNYAGSFLTMNNVTITGATNGVVMELPTTFSGEHLHITRYTGIGIETEGGSATLRDSVISGPGTSGTSIGIYVTGSGSSTGSFLADHSEVSANATGAEADGADGPGILRLSDMVITGNGTGLLPNNGGQVLSFRTNSIAGNTVDGVPSLGLSLK